MFCFDDHGDEVDEFDDPSPLGALVYLLIFIALIVYLGYFS